MAWHFLNSFAGLHAARMEWNFGFRDMYLSLVFAVPSLPTQMPSKLHAWKSFIIPFQLPIKTLVSSIESPTTLNVRTFSENAHFWLTWHCLCLHRVYVFTSPNGGFLDHMTHGMSDTGFLETRLLCIYPASASEIPSGEGRTSVSWGYQGEDQTLAAMRGWMKCRNQHCPGELLGWRSFTRSPETKPSVTVSYSQLYSDEWWFLPVQLFTTLDICWKVCVAPNEMWSPEKESADVWADLTYGHVCTLCELPTFPNLQKLVGDFDFVTFIFELSCIGRSDLWFLKLICPLRERRRHTRVCMPPIYTKRISEKAYRISSFNGWLCGVWSLPHNWGEGGGPTGGRCGKSLAEGQSNKSLPI